MSPDPASPRYRFGLKFVLLARAWRRELDHVLAGIGLTDATWIPLIHLEEFGDGVSQKVLAERVGLDGSSLVRLLDLLTERGYIERRVDERDRRARHIFLTDAGRAILADIRCVLRSIETELLADIDDGEIDAALDMFRRIDARLTEREAERTPNT